MLVAVVLVTTRAELAPVALSVAMRPVRARLAAAPGGAGLGGRCICRVGIGGKCKYKCQGGKDQGKFDGAHVYSPYIDLPLAVGQMAFFSFSYSSRVISPEASRFLSIDMESV